MPAAQWAIGNLQVPAAQWAICNKQCARSNLQKTGTYRRTNVRLHILKSSNLQIFKSSIPRILASSNPRILDSSKKATPAAH
jgi:hypothetical protein